MPKHQSIMVSNLSSHIGSFVEFEFVFAFDDVQTMRGYLHGLTPHDDGYKTYLHISDNPTFPSDKNAYSIGGYALENNELVTIYL